MNIYNFFPGAVLYKILEKYKLREDELVEHGFPRPGERKGQAVIKPRDDRKEKPRDSTYIWRELK